MTSAQTKNKRSVLASLGNKKRYTFRGIYARCGYKRFKNHYTPTLMFRNVTHNKKLVTSHLWFTYTKGFLKLGVLHDDDIVQFNARVSTYMKGYGPREAQTMDYQLNYPTKIKLIKKSDNQKRIPYPTSRKKLDIVVGHAMKVNKNFYLSDMRPFSEFRVHLWENWCAKHQIANLPSTFKPVEKLLIILRKHKWSHHHRGTLTKYDFSNNDGCPNINLFLNIHQALKHALNVQPFGNELINLSNLNIITRNNLANMVYRLKNRIIHISKMKHTTLSDYATNQKPHISINTIPHLEMNKTSRWNCGFDCINNLFKPVIRKHFKDMFYFYYFKHPQSKKLRQKIEYYNHILMIFAKGYSNFDTEKQKISIILGFRLLRDNNSKDSLVNLDAKTRYELRHSLRRIIKKHKYSEAEEFKLIKISIKHLDFPISLLELKEG